MRKKLGDLKDRQPWKNKKKREEIMKRSLLLFAVLVVFFAGALHAEEVVLFDFENGLEGWEIPDWAFENRIWSRSR